MLLSGLSVLAESEAPTGRHDTVAPVLERVAALARRVLAEAGIPQARLAGVGVGLPGEVDPDTGIFLSSPILPTWRDVPAARLLQERLHVPVRIENDANTALLGEMSAGAGRDADPLLLLTLGTGIGGAIAIGGRLVRGFAGSAGEVGHLVVAPEGSLCGCGNRGCLGMMASATALCALYRERAGVPDDLPVDGLLVAARFREGHPAAVHAVHRVAQALARGIASAAVVFAPQRVILAGGIVTGLGDPILSLVRANLAAHPYPAVLARMEILPAALGPKAGALGAATLVPLEAP